MSNQVSPTFYMMGTLFFVGSAIVFFLTIFLKGSSTFEALFDALPLIILGFFFMLMGSSIDSYYHSDEFRQKRIENLKRWEEEREDGE